MEIVNASGSMRGTFCSLGKICEYCLMPHSWTNSKLISIQDVSLSQEEICSYNMLKRQRGILNRLTPTNFKTLAEQFANNSAKSMEDVKSFCGLIMEKAMEDDVYSLLYSNFCAELHRSYQLHGYSVRDVLQDLCVSSLNERFLMYLNLNSNFSDQDNDYLVKYRLYIAESSYRRKTVGLCIFIANLYNIFFINSDVLCNILRHFLFLDSDLSTECLCKLLEVAGSQLEIVSHHECAVSDVLSECLNYAEQLLEGKRDVCYRIRFLLLDLLEMSQNAWIPRKNLRAVPKTLSEIFAEFELEMTKTYQQKKHKKREPKHEL